MFVGGEFYYDHRWISETPTLSTKGMYFLNGGKACLIAISDYLLDHGIDKILLPSYLCPSIVTTLERRGIMCDDYQTNEDLSIDLDDLARKAERHKAVYFINYFGFLHPPEIRQYFKTLRQNGMIIVEDNAQAAFHHHPTGDFIFNSLRKLSPYDGGYLITQLDITPYLKKYHDLPNRRLPIIRAYREQLYDYLLTGAGSHSELETMFSLAEQYYDEDLVVLGDLQERDRIERLEWQGIKQVRRENYQYLMSLISSVPEISPIFPVLQDDNLPLGLPVYFSGVSRDRVCDELGSASIGLSVHWDDIPHHPHTRKNRLAVDMANRMLTLVIDQRTSHKQMDYLALNLAQAIEKST